MARAADPTTQPTRSLAPGTRIGAVLSTYHGELSGAMLAAAQAELARAGLAADGLLVASAPGAFELPLIARQLGVREDIACVLCFGLILKGETSHDQHLASAVSHALQQVALQLDKPILFGVLTCGDIEQARARALATEDGGKHDKGREVARAAIDALAALRTAREVGIRRQNMGFAAPAAALASAPSTTKNGSSKSAFAGGKAK